MQFKEIVGYADLKKHLVDSVKAERTAHAQLLLGPEGSAKLAIAWAYAQFLLCEAPLPHDSCGQCKSCKSVAKLVHIDLHFSYPTVGSKATSSQFIKEWREILQENPYFNTDEWLNRLQAENKQGNITKDECVELMHKMSLKAYQGGRKILILWMPEFLGKEANRLLKLIEEPPADTVFLLVAENTERILNTILSRCQLVHVPPFTDADIISCLQAKEVPAEKAQQLAYLADGNLNKALQLQHNVQGDQFEWFITWLRCCYKGKASEMIDWVSGMAGGKRADGERLGRKDQLLFLQYGLFFLREYLQLKMLPDTTPRLSSAELNAAQGLLKLLGLSEVQYLATLLDDCALCIERNANPKILLLDASVQIKRMFGAVKKRAASS